MGINVTLKHNSSPVEKIGKDLDAGVTFECLLKADTSILKPVIIINTEYASMPTFNYMYIDDFSRYYFIDDIVSKNNDIWEVSGHVDVLETYKDAILQNEAVIRRQQSQYNTYLNDPEWKVYAYETRWAKKFPTAGFSKALQFVLTTAGS